MEFTYPDISCNLYSLKNFQDREFASRVLKKIEEYGENFMPDKFGFYEPLKKDYHDEGKEGALKLWLNEEGNRRHIENNHDYAVGQLIARKKSGSKASYFMTWEKEKTGSFNLFSLDVGINFLQKKGNIRNYLNLCYELAEIIEPVHGEIINCSFPKWSEPMNLNIRIPELHWAVIFGKPYIEMFGKDKLLNTPCHKVERINDDTLILYLTENVFEPLPSKIRREIKEYLGKDSFVEEGKTSHSYKSGKVPDFDYSQVVFRESDGEITQRIKRGTEMRRDEIAGSIAEKANVSKQDVEMIIDSLQNMIEESLSHGEKVILDGFGVFEARLLPERIGEHPINGNRIVIPSRKEVMFKASMNLKESINKVQS